MNAGAINGRVKWDFVLGLPPRASPPFPDSAKARSTIFAPTPQSRSASDAHYLYRIDPHTRGLAGSSAGSATNPRLSQLPWNEYQGFRTSQSPVPGIDHRFGMAWGSALLWLQVPAGFEISSSRIVPSQTTRRCLVRSPSGTTTGGPGPGLPLALPEWPSPFPRSARLSVVPEHWSAHIPAITAHGVSPARDFDPPPARLQAGRE